jgi:Domain of unknown function (DUF4253)
MSAAVPFELVEATGEQAFATWQLLKSAGRGVPVVLGGDDDLLFEPLGWPDRRPVAEILAVADGLTHPEDLLRFQAEEGARAMEYLRQRSEQEPDVDVPKMIVWGPDGPRQLSRQETLALVMAEPQGAPLGEWPSEVDGSPGLSVAFDVATGEPLRSCRIALVPTEDWTTIPAHLNWGGWNACPHPEYQVAALRSWRDRFGAELAGLAFDTMNLKVAHRPASRAEALDLAREQYAYCNDIVDQGVGTLSRLAACLAAHDWWFFWWD